MTKLIIHWLLLPVVFCSCNPNKQRSSDPDQPVPTEQTTIADHMHKSAKRGVAFNFSSTEDMNALLPYISWDYNWANTPGETAGNYMEAYEVNFCPMCWSRNYSANKIRSYVQNNPSAKYLLGYNEPNLTDQANMTPTQAAEGWPEVVSLAKELNLKLVAPALNYGTLEGYSDPIKWLDEFIGKVGKDDMAALALHCYMPSASGVRGFIDLFDKYDKPIWLTEFCAWEQNISSPDAQARYLCEMLNYLEQTEKVERYSWFIPRYQTEDKYPYMQLLKDGFGNGLTDLGKIYCWFSSFDKSVYLKRDGYIYGGEYVAVGQNNLNVRPCKDKEVGTEGLMLYDWSTGNAVTYQMANATEDTALTIRYATLFEAMLNVRIDGKDDYLILPKSGSNLANFASAVLPVSIPAGKHEIVLELVQGNVNISGLRFGGKTPKEPVSGYQLVWSEEFDDAALNTDVWNIEVNGNGGGNNELQYYCEKAVTLGTEPTTGAHCLILTATKEEYKGKSCTSGRINSQGKYYFTYGKVEARIKFPNTANGLWPAFWMMGNNFSQVGWPRCGELDIIELGNSNAFRSGTQDRYFNGAMHVGASWDRVWSDAQAKTWPYSVEDTFHIVTCEWTPDSVKIYMDKNSHPENQPYFVTRLENNEDPAYDRKEVWSKPNFLILNLAVGGNFPGIHDIEGITALADGPAHMYVDWIRVYQLDQRE